MNELELRNALAWFRSAPQRLYEGASARVAQTAEWVWVVLQGDFAEEQTTAQAVTGTIISMIPFVDQICDVRDIVANCKKINEDKSNKWAWLALVLTLIGLFPSLGSLAKGCFKILFAYLRKGVFSAGAKALDSNLWQVVQPFVEAGIRKLNDFLARPEVRATLSRLHIDNVYQYLANQLRVLKGKLNVGGLLGVFDQGIGAFKELMAFVQRWGGAALAERAKALVEVVARVRRDADRMLGQAIKPAQELVDRLINRLELEHAQTYRATTNALNPHNFAKLSLDAEVAALRRARPEWVKVGTRARYPALTREPAVPSTHVDIGAKGPRGLTDAFRTFADVRPDILPKGTVIYRVVDPKSFDNSICWMTEAEFKQLSSKREWRERFAVWGHWNGNGEYVRYTVPEGGLPVWRGTTASQELQDYGAGKAVAADAKGNTFWIDGGAEQLVVNPGDLKREHVSARRFTGWTDGSAEIEVNLVGVPSLNSWR